MLIRVFTLLLLMISLTTPAKNAAKIYVWRNEAGVLVFSDSPKAGAEEMDVKQDNNVMSSVDTSILDIKPKIVQENYQVAITQPESHATVRDNTGSIYIAGRIKPVFKQGHTIQLYLDGKPYETAQPQAMFILRDVDRGEHQVKMELLNDKGKVIASSQVITFYMHRASK
ncbi:MAG: DUF4124 domain-containing protein [Thalassotalea sp.]